MRLRRRETGDDDRGQALMIVVAVMAVAALLIGATQLAVISDISLTSSSLNIEKAQQAAESGLADYEAWVKASANGWQYALSYCSSGVTGYCANNPPTTGETPDPNNPAFTAKPDSTCTTSAATYTGPAPGTPGSPKYQGWESVRGSSSGSEQFQYVVDASKATSAGGYVHLFVTGRAGQSGRYTCRTIKVYYQGPTTSLVSQSILAPSSCNGTSLTETAPAGAAYMQITATGGTGQSGGNGLVSLGGALGGQGATVQAIYAVNAGSPVYVAQGCQGGSSQQIAAGGPGFAQGGNNSKQSGSFIWGNAGGGGGSTAVCSTATCCNVVATNCATAIQNLTGGSANVQNDVYLIAGGGGGGGESFFGDGGNGANGDSTTINSILPYTDSHDSPTSTATTAAATVSSFGVGANATIASGSNAVNVNTFAGSGVLSVNSTSLFLPSGTLQVMTGSGAVEVSYTGTTTTSFTGCTTLNSGTGVMVTGGAVSQWLTLPVASAVQFPAEGTLTVVTSAGTATLNYTGTTGTSFTGVTLGSGSGTAAVGAGVILTQVGQEDDGNAGTSGNGGAAGGAGLHSLATPLPMAGGTSVPGTTGGFFGTALEAAGGGGGAGFNGGGGGQPGYAGGGGGSGSSFCNTNLGYQTGTCLWASTDAAVTALGYGDVSIQWLSSVKAALGNPIVPSNCGPNGFRNAAITPGATVTVNAQGGNGGGGDNADILALGGAQTAGGSGASITASYTNTTAQTVYVTAIQGCSGVIGAFDGGDPGGPGLGGGGYNVRCNSPPGPCPTTSRVFNGNTSNSGGSGSGGGASALCVGTNPTTAQNGDNCYGTTTVGVASDGFNLASFNAATQLGTQAAGYSTAGAFVSESALGTCNGVTVTACTAGGTLPVVSTTGFPTAGTLKLATLSGGPAYVTYTGTNPTGFTGAAVQSGGGSTLATGLAVNLWNSLVINPAITGGTGGFPASGTLNVTTSGGTAQMTYQGLTTTSFTGVVWQSGATGTSTLSAGGAVTLDGILNVGSTTGLEPQGTLQVTVGSGTITVPVTCVGTPSPTTYTQCTASGTGGESTTVTSGSNGASLTSFTGSQQLNVGSTAGFPTTGGTLNVVTSTGTTEQLTYTSATSTAFTGVSDYNGDTGTLATGGYVAISVPLTAGNAVAALAVNNLLLVAGGGGGGAETGCFLSFGSFGLSDPGGKAGVGANWSGGTSTAQPASGVVKATAGGGSKDGTPGGTTFGPGGGPGSEDSGGGAGDGGGGGDGYGGGGGGQVGSCFFGIIPDPGSGGGGGGSSYLSALDAGVALTTCAAGTATNCPVLGTPNKSTAAIDEALWSTAAANSNGAIGITETGTQIPPGVVYQQPTGGGSTW